MTAAQQQSTSTRAVQDTARLFGARMAAGAVSVFFTGWLLRLIPAEDLAVWPIAIALGAAVEGLSSLGMGDTFVRRVPRYLAEGRSADAGSLLRTGLLLNVVAAIVATAFLVAYPDWAAKHILRDPSKTSLVTNLGLVVLAIAVQKRLGWALKATQQFHHIAILSLFTHIGLAPLGVLLYLNYGMAGLLAAFAIIPAIAAVATIVWLWPHLWIGGGLRPLGDLLQFSAPFYGVSLLGFLQGQAHYLVVGLLTTPEVLAVYFVASKVSDYLRELDGFGISAITPKFAERGGVDECSRPRIMAKCSRYIFLVLMPTHLGVAALAGPITHLYAGSAYGAASTILAVLSLYGFVELLHNLHRSQVQIYSPPLHLLALQAIAAVLNVAAIGLLVWAWGAVGAAVARLVVYTLLTVIAARILSRTMPLRYDLQAARGALQAGVLMVGACVAVAALLPGAVPPVLVGVSLGGLVYLAALRGRASDDDVDLVVRTVPSRIRSLAIARKLGALLQAWLVPSAPEISAPAGGGAE